MSSLQAALKPLMWDTQSPRELCRRLNRILCEIAPVGKFVSFFYAVLDSKSNRLTYCNAGHNPPVLVRADGAASELNAAGAVLGQFPDWIYEQSEMHGDAETPVLFTDGVVEACNQDEQPFGEERLIQIARENREAGAEGLEKLRDRSIERLRRTVVRTTPAWSCCGRCEFRARSNMPPRSQMAPSWGLTPLKSVLLSVP